VLISNAFDVCHLMLECTVLVDTPAPDHVKPCKQVNIPYIYIVDPVSDSQPVLYSS